MHILYKLAQEKFVMLNRCVCLRAWPRSSAESVSNQALQVIDSTVTKTLRTVAMSLDST